MGVAIILFVIVLFVQMVAQMQITIAALTVFDYVKTWSLTYVRLKKTGVVSAWLLSMILIGYLCWQVNVAILNEAL